MTGRIKTTRQARKARKVALRVRAFKANRHPMCRCVAFLEKRSEIEQDDTYMPDSLAAAHTTDLREQSKFYAVKAMPDGVGE